MATGIIGTLSGAGTISYSPAVNAKAIIACPASQVITMQGVSVTAPTAGQLEAFVGAGQTLTLTITSGSLFLSSLEAL